MWGGQQQEWGQSHLLVPEADDVHVGAGVAQIRDVGPQLQHPREEAGFQDLEYQSWF